MNEFSHPDAARQAEENPEFAEAYRDLEDGLRSRREAVAALEPDPRSQARLKQAMVRWVEDEITEEFRQRSLSARFGRRVRSLAATWRDLIGGSRAFRYGARGALALGLGLILGFGVDMVGKASVRASSTPSAAEDGYLPTPTRFDIPEVSPARDAESVRISRSRLPNEPLEETPRQRR